MNKGCLPCLQVVPADTDGDNATETANGTQVRIVSISFKMKKDVRYIAMSHVWSDGTGNGQANSLPLCQLRAIYQRVSRFHRTRDPRFEDRPVLLWMDTVCCPYEHGPAKNFALTKMKGIYLNATAIHVWDQSLLSLKARGDSQEWITRIWLSKWMRRLWTVQEAIFATQYQDFTLIIHCADATEPMTRLYRHAYRKKRYGSDVVLNIARQLTRVEKLGWPGTRGGSPRQLLETAWLVQYRYISVPADEILVLANVLGLDGADFIGLTHEEGMHKLWSQIFTTLPPTELTHSIPFCPTPKLTIPGFRWAPRSLMDRQCYGPSTFFVSSGDCRYQAEITSAGLVAHYRGVTVKPCHAPKAACLLGNNVNFCEKDFVRSSFPLSDGSWLRVDHSTLTGEDLIQAQTRQYERLRRGTLAFVFQFPNVREEPVVTHALILELTGERDGVHHAAIDCHVVVDKHRFYPAKLHTAAKDVAMRTLMELQDLSSRQPSSDDIQRIFDQRARTCLEEDAELCEAIRLNSREDMNAKKNWTFEQVLEEFKERVHHHAHIGPVEIIEHPEWTKWYISEGTLNVSR